LEGEIKSHCSRIEQLEGEIEELKVLDDEELKKLAKTEEVQVLEANMHVLERQLEGVGDYGRSRAAEETCIHQCRSTLSIVTL
jgi:hypothetical protein